MPEGSAYFVWGSPPRAPARVCGRRTPAPRIRGWPSTSSATTRRSARAAIAARDSRSSPTRTSRTEDGIRDRLAFFGSLPAERLTHRTKGRNEVETFGFGDVNLGLRYRLWNRGVVFS